MILPLRRFAAAAFAATALLSVSAASASAAAVQVTTEPGSGIGIMNEYDFWGDVPKAWDYFPVEGRRVALLTSGARSTRDVIVHELGHLRTAVVVETRRLTDDTVEVEMTARLFDRDQLVDEHPLRPASLAPGQSVMRSFHLQDEIDGRDYANAKLILSNQLVLGV